MFLFYSKLPKPMPSMTFSDRPLRLRWGDGGSLWSEEGLFGLLLGTPKDGGRRESTLESFFFFLNL